MIYHYNDWIVEVNNHTISFTKGNHKTREYDLMEWSDLTIKDNYIYLKNIDSTESQFKLEEGEFIVGDLFDKYGEHIDTLACWVFSEEYDVFD
jgi:hypothetical protein